MSRTRFPFDRHRISNLFHRTTNPFVSHLSQRDISKLFPHDRICSNIQSRILHSRIACRTSGHTFACISLYFFNEDAFRRTHCASRCSGGLSVGADISFDKVGWGCGWSELVGLCPEMWGCCVPGLLYTLGREVGLFTAEYRQRRG